MPILSMAQTVQNKSIHKTKLVDVQISSEVHAMVANSKATRTAVEQKMTSDVLEVVKQYQVNGNTLQKRPGQLTPQSFSPIQPASHPKVDTLDRVYVYLHLIKGHSSAEVIPVLTSLGGEADFINDKFLLIQAWVPVVKLSVIAGLPATGLIDLIIPPGHNTGPVTSEGDSRLRSDIARAVMPGATGNGVKVGVMSDDCGSVENLVNPRITNGELGAGTTVLIDNLGGGRTHEGLAMMEIVQDVAPSAQIYFATAATGEGQFATNIGSLASAGCKVITDDEIYFDEPVFEDGIVAQEVNTVATSNNVVYTSSSTNVGNSNYFGIYNPLAGQNVGNTGGGPFNVHNYGAGAFLNSFTFPGGGTTLFFILTWDDQYGASGNDFDLYVVNQNNTVTFGSSTNTQNGTQNPNEVVSLTNNGASITCNIIIVRKGVSGGDPNPTPRMKLAIWQGIPMQFGTTASSTWGHACATGAIGCGAIGADRNSTIGSENNYINLEAFSSQGPVYMVQFGAGLVGGNRPLLSTRIKPDVASFDGVTTSVPGFAPFYGTSASAPHAAGLAAQVISMFPGLTSSQYRTVIENGCIDYGAAGKDNAYGFGRTDAFRTIALQQAVTTPATYIAKFATPGTAIPDNNGIGITSSVNFSLPCANITPSSIYVSVTVDGHNKTGDLIYTLTSPDNTSITLMNRPVNGAGNATAKNPNIVFGDAASTAIQTANPAGKEQVGFFIPANSISTAGGFGSHGLGGTWTLTASDNAVGNTGTLKDWGIYAIEGAATAPQLTISWNPPFIFPDDHTLRNISVSNSLSGGCSPAIVLQSVTSNEPDAGTGGGDIAGDIQGATTGVNTLNFQLRSECSPNAPYGKGRYYTIDYRITDIGGYQRDTIFAIPVLCVPGRVDPSTDIPFAGLSLDVAPSPDPLTTTSAIQYTIPGPSNASVLLTVCNNLGKWVDNLDYGNKGAGTYTLNWSGTAADGSPLPNGVYAYQLRVGAPYNALKTGVVIINH